MYVKLDDEYHYLDEPTKTICGIEVPSHVIAWDTEPAEGEDPHCGPDYKKPKAKKA